MRTAGAKEIPSIDSFDITVSDIINSFSGNAIMPSAKCGFCNTTFDIFSQTGKLDAPNATMFLRTSWQIRLNEFTEATGISARYLKEREAPIK